MKSYADTGVLVSLYLVEQTTQRAIAEISRVRSPLPVLSLGVLEFHNALNFALNRKRISMAERDQIKKRFETQFQEGFFVPLAIPSVSLYKKAHELSDRYTPVSATRTLDLLHVAAALLNGADEMITFDERQRQVARSEGLKVR